MESEILWQIGGTTKQTDSRFVERGDWRTIEKRSYQYWFKTR